MVTEFSIMFKNAATNLIITFVSCMHRCVNSLFIFIKRLLHISSDSLLIKLGINNIQTLLRYNRLRWFGHVVRNDGCINSITEFEVVGQRGRGRPKKTWKDTINNDLRHWKLSRADPANRMEWRKKLRTNIGAVRPTLSGTDTLNE